MIRAKTSTQQWIVPLCDPALHRISIERFSQYGRTRDLKLLGCSEDGVLAITAEKVTMFRVAPLKQGLAHLLDTPGVTTNQVIFAACVKAVKNAEGLPWGMTEDHVSEEFLAAMPQDTIDDIASFVIEQTRGANGTDIPFTLPVGWRVARQGSADLRAMFAAKENAEATPIKTGV